MSLTLGEKLRQAREERGITISEVAEQTRISALYLSSIESDDYRKLPGGIFNKGFVKSFAKSVGVDEQEALQEYARLVADQDNEITDDPKTYRPEVLTDDSHSSSRLITIISAAVILTLMAIGVLMLVKYIEPMATQPAANTSSNANMNANSIANLSLVNANTPIQTAPMNNFTVEFKALKSRVSLTSIVDGEKIVKDILPDKSGIFQPKESLRLRYSKSQTRNVQMTVNGKQITLPSQNGSREVIEFEIKQSDFEGVFDGGQIGDSLLIKTKEN